MAEMAVTIVSQPSGDLGPQHDYAYVEYEFSERWAVRIDVQTDEKVGTDLWEHRMTWDYPVPSVSFYLQRPTTSVRYKFTGVSTGEVIISQIASWTWVNAVPVISGTVADLGEKDAPFSYTYSVSDPDGDKLTVTEKLNETTIRTLTEVTSGSELTLTISADEFGALADQAQHTITITVDDGLNGTDTQAMVFTKNASVDVTAPQVEPRAYFLSPGFVAYMRPSWTMQGYGEMLPATTGAGVRVALPVAEAVAEALDTQMCVDVSTTLPVIEATADVLPPIIRSGVLVTAGTSETMGEMLSACADIVTWAQAIPADLSSEMLAPIARASVSTIGAVAFGEANLLTPRVSNSVSLLGPIAEALGELLLPIARAGTTAQAVSADILAGLLPPIARADTTAQAMPAETIAELLAPHVETLYIVQVGVSNAWGELLPLSHIITGTGYVVQVSCIDTSGEMLGCVVRIHYTGPRLTALARPQDIKITELPGRLDLIDRKSRLEVFNK